MHPILYCIAGLMTAGFMLVMGCLAMAPRNSRDRRAGGEDEDHD